MNSLPEVHLRLAPADGRTLDVVVSGVTIRTTLADLASLVSPTSVPLELTVDGRPVSATSSLVAAGVVQGSHLGWAAPAGPTSPLVSGGVRLRCVAGPDWGRVIELPPGRHVVGRAGATATGIDDPTLAPRQVVFDVGGDGSIDVEDLGVGRPSECDGPLLRIGATEVLVEAGPDPGSERGPVGGRSAAGPWRTSVVRQARPAAHGIAPIRRLDVAAPAERSATGIGLVSTGIAAIGGAVVGLLLGQPLMVLLSVVGTLGALATFAIQAGRDRRSRRLHRTALADESDRFRRELDLATDEVTARLRPGAPWSLGTEVTFGSLWDSRLASMSLWSPVIGTGSLGWEPPVEGDEIDPVVLDHVAVPLELHRGAVVAVVGDTEWAGRVVRSLVLQAAVGFGPADLRIVGDPEHGAPRWRRWLPHHDDRLESDDHDERTDLLVLDAPDALSVRTSAVRRRLDRSAARAFTVVACGADDPVPQVCTHVVRVGSGGTAEVLHVAPPAGAVFARPAMVHRVIACGVGERSADRIGRALSRYVDPELPADRAGLPDRVELADLIGSAHGTAEAIVERWADAGPDPAPALTLGVAADGRIELDLRRDGPHALIAGTTGSGKSELLRSLVAGLALSAPPHLLQFILVDYKGGSAFDACSSLPHVAGMVTDLDGRLAERMLASLEAELKRRERVFRECGAADLAAHRRAGGPAVSRLVVVVDEFAALAAELPDFLASLIGVAQRGRSLGVHLVLATQRPAGVVDDDIRANTDLRVCLRVQDHADALDVVGDRRAADLPRSVPGRALLRLGSEPPVVFQTPSCTGPERVGHDALRLRLVGSPADRSDPEGGPTFLGGLVERIVAAHRLAAAAVPKPVPVWTEPLPAALTTDDDRVIGEIDDVAAQSRRPLGWDPGAGHLLVAARRGAGVSSTLARVVSSLAATSPPDELHVFVVDGAGAGSLEGLRGLSHCGGVIDGADADGLERLLALLERRVDGSGMPHGSEVTTVVAIDDAGAFRNRLVGPDGVEFAERWSRLVTDGAAAVSFVFGIDHPSAIPMSWQGRCADRWVGVLADPLDATAFGLPSAAALRGAPPGRFVVGVHDGSPLDAQIARCDGPGASWIGRIAASWRDRPATVTRLDLVPGTIEVADLPAPAARPSSSGVVIELPIGIRSVTLESVSLTVHPGDHGLVLGPARSGRSSFLGVLADRWELLFGPGATVTVAGREPEAHGLGRRIDEVVGHGRPCLVLVDDAERFADTEGALADALTHDRREVHVVAAGRPDAIRSCGYGHWTAALRRPAWGLLLGAVNDADTDLLGIPLPRRRPVRPTTRPGSGLLSVDGVVVPVRVASAPREGAQRGGAARPGSAGHECFG